MNDNKFSKNTKIKLRQQNIETHRSFIKTRRTTDPTNSLIEYLADGIDEEYQVKPCNMKVFFPVTFRTAVGSDHGRVVELFTKAIELHNEYIAGSYFPRDWVEYAYYEELAEHREKIISFFAHVGKKLGYKKRRMRVELAQNFLQKNVLSPLDKLAWQPDTRLNLLFEHAIDVLAQHFLSPFIESAITPDYSRGGLGVIMSLEKTDCSNQNIGYLENQAILYNVPDYVVATQRIEMIDKLLEREYCVEDRLSIDDMLFDVFELIPLYSNQWSPEQNVIPVGNDYYFYPILNFGFPTFILSPKDKTLSESWLTTYQFQWLITGTFSLSANYCLASKELGNIGTYLLSKLHEKLLALYTVRQPPKVTHVDYKTSVYEYDKFTYDYHTRLSARDDRINHVSEEIHIKGNIPSLTLSSFLKILQEKFDCNVGSGKGSELKVWRDNTHIYTIGRHKRDPKLLSKQVRRILTRLKISTSDWLLELSR